MFGTILSIVLMLYPAEGHHAVEDLEMGMEHPMVQSENDRSKHGFSPDKVSSAGSNGVVGKAENEAQAQTQTPNLDSSDGQNQDDEHQEPGDDLETALVNAIAADDVSEGEGDMDESSTDDGSAGAAEGDDLAAQLMVELESNEASLPESPSVAPHANIGLNTDQNATPLSSFQSRSSDPCVSAEGGQCRREPNHLPVAGAKDRGPVATPPHDVSPVGPGFPAPNPDVPQASPVAPKLIPRHPSIQNDIERDFFADYEGDVMEGYNLYSNPSRTEASGVDAASQGESSMTSSGDSSCDDSSSCDGNSDEDCMGSGAQEVPEIEHF